MESLPNYLHARERGVMKPEARETRAAAREDLSRLAPFVAWVVIFYYKTNGIT